MSDLSPQQASPATATVANPENVGGYTEEELGQIEKLKGIVEIALAAGRAIILGSSDEKDQLALKTLTDKGVLNGLMSNDEKRRVLDKIRRIAQGVLNGVAIKRRKDFELLYRALRETT
ncbi:MAG: hypothetical protein WC802_05135 [Patescibacteria group bacterium]